jgi:uncharacterized protein (TIGR02284 family)
MNATHTPVTNDLLQVLADGEEGFQKASESVKDPELKTLFAGYAAERAEMARELIRFTDADPDEKTSSVSGSLHRGWINLKAALTAGNDHAILAECERGEDHAVEAYRKALEEELPPEVRAVAESHSVRILAVHNQVKALRDAAKDS